jgi:formate hydrogenlyase subunit 6/NADH:ubiquinone oxidoreductase subunit I
MVDDELYRALQRHMDRMPVPYPATESGVEIRILKRLFTPEEARLALCLSVIPEPLRTIHRRVRGVMTREQLCEALDRMAEKGSIRKLQGKKGPRYAKSPLVLGMYEAQVNRLTPELEREVRSYFDEGFGAAIHGPLTPQMRIVPVNKSIPVEHAVASYDDIRRFVEASPGPFAAIPCVCRQGRELTGQPCRLTNEPRNCLMFGKVAAMMTERGIARPVRKEEMLALLEQADRQGLVLEPQNTQDPLFVCCCCGCCCGVLTTAKKLPRPAEFFQTDFVAQVDRERCELCGTCATRCQMDAIVADNEPAKVAEERCIGCGLCVTTCPSEAMSLRKKERRPPPPKDMAALYSTMFQQRFGRLGAASTVAGHFLGRKF